MTREVQVELRGEPMEVYEGDVFVLASDGLTDLARNDDILVTVTEYLKSRDGQTV
jgi:serine/threonine protein phosphatase PrpC